MCSAAATGRLIDWSGRASILPVPQSRCIAIDLNVFSSTVLPTPRNPVSTMLRSGRPRATRSRTTSNWPISRSRPVSSGGRCPAPGAYGLRTGSIHRTVWRDLARALDLARKPYRRVAGSAVVLLIEPGQVGVVGGQMLVVVDVLGAAGHSLP